MKGHYLMLVLDDGAREYFALVSEDETIEEATERWVLEHPRMKGRVRSRVKTANAVRAAITYSRITRPTSWHRAKAEEAGLPFPVPQGRRRRRR